MIFNIIKYIQLYQVCSCASALLVWKAEELVANDTIFYYILFYDRVIQVHSNVETSAYFLFDRTS